MSHEREWNWCKTHFVLSLWTYRTFEAIEGENNVKRRKYIIALYSRAGVPMTFAYRIQKYEKQVKKFEDIVSHPHFSESHTLIAKLSPSRITFQFQVSLHTARRICKISPLTLSKQSIILSPIRSKEKRKSDRNTPRAFREISSKCSKSIQLARELLPLMSNENLLPSFWNSLWDSSCWINMKVC